MTPPITRPVPPRLRGRKIIKVGALTYAQMVKHMLHGDMSCHELAEVTGLHYVTVLHYTRELHAAGAAHICGWLKDSRGRDVIKLYKIGEGKDATRERKPASARSADYRRRKRIALTHRALAGVAA